MRLEPDAKENAMNKTVEVETGAKKAKKTSAAAAGVAPVAGGGPPAGGARGR